MKLCIIHYDKQYQTYEVRNEFCSCIARHPQWKVLDDWITENGYVIIPNNTRFAKTILDKINQHHI